jgi:hypothetical protein
MERLRLGSRTWAKTIAVVEPQRLKNLGVSGGDSVVSNYSTETVRRDTFKIRMAHDAARTREAHFLVEKRYGEKGYIVSGEPGRVACPERITLATYKEEEVIATLTIGFDTGSGLLADELYKSEIDSLRRDGRLVCEFTKLAIDTKRASKRMMGGLFHIAVIYAVRIWGYTDIIIEVNPSHVSFYKRMLGFEDFGEERMCPRVNAPAVLLHIETSYVHDMILKFGGRVDISRNERSMYPYFMSPEEEAAVIERLMQG